jgi:ectoine hydroxylase-related dioxygenase (phytanoyl-CoA dioxygenase family)
MCIGPGAKAQPLHRDDYLHHNVHTEVDVWVDERDKNRESAVGLFVAGSQTTMANGATRFIPGSHLWYLLSPHPQETHSSSGYKYRYSAGTSTDWLDRGNYERKSPPNEALAVQAELDKGDAFFMFASCFHGGSANTTIDQQRLVYSTFVTRGWLRQEDNVRSGVLSILVPTLGSYPWTCPSNLLSVHAIQCLL